MAVLMSTILLIILVVGTAALSGDPLPFIAVAVLLAGAVYVLTGRARRGAIPMIHSSRRKS
ncbi:MAG TPA: hypothetical protein VFR67_18095 [Pilimelia sp.]|nr:hypothetical protein [Pilimelia sp.]